MPNVFMLDTDVCSYIIRKKPKELENVFISHQDDVICMSVITYAALQYGVLNKQSARLKQQVDDFISLIKVIDWTDATARRYAEIRHHLTKTGRTIGNMDILIAAAALAMNAQLVTNNKKHFSGVPGLQIADWL